MNARSLFRMCLVVLVTAGAVAAQERGERGQRRRGGQGGDRGGFRQRGGFGQRGGINVEALAEAVKLDEEQMGEVQAIIDDYRQDQREIMRDMRGDPEMREKQRDLREDMRDARESGDDAKLEELNEQMQKIRQEQQKAQAPMRKKLDELLAGSKKQITEVLHEDQMKAFETYWTQMMARRAGQRTPNARALKAAVDKLDLSTEQEDQIADLFQQFQKENREAGRRGQGRRGGGEGEGRGGRGAGRRGERRGGGEGEERGGRAGRRGGRGGEGEERGGRAGRRGGRRGGQQGNQRLQTKLYNDVLEVLSDSQKKKIQRELQQRQGRQRGQRGDRGGERGRFRRGGEDPS